MKPTWDLFHPPKLDDVEPFDQSLCYKLLTKVLRVCAYLITFCLVLGTAVTSKLSLLLMTSRIGPQATIAFCIGSSADKKPGSSTPVPEEEEIYWTWLLFIAFGIPELFTFLRSLRFCLSKGQEGPTLGQFLLPLFSETLHTAGLALFVYVCLPRLDSVTGAAVSTGACLVPAFLLIFSDFNTETGKIRLALNVAAALLLVGALVLWVIKYPQPITNTMWLPFSLLLISFGWWQSYVHENSSTRFGRWLARMKSDLLKSGYKSYVFISVWKIVVFFIMMIVAHEINGGSSWNLFSLLGDAFAFRTESRHGRPNGVFVWTHPLFVHVISGVLCYYSAKYACKLCTHAVSVALPLVLLTIPTVVFLLVSALRDERKCFVKSPFYGNLAFSVPQDLSEAFYKQCLWIPVLFLVSKAWVTAHIWFPKHVRMARVENIFVTPKYSSFLIDASLTMNQPRRDFTLNFTNIHCCTTERVKTMCRNIVRNRNSSDMQGSQQQQQQTGADAHDELKTKIPEGVPRIKACATMWHETREEMSNLVKSICRMDKDHSNRWLAVKELKADIFGARFYKFKTHIFFDDAFTLENKNVPNSAMVLNEYVRMLISVVDEEVLQFYKGRDKLKFDPPRVYATPYGGRLVWTLPGLTKLVVHLKDNSKIRNKKRWSQCMYMYYLLSYKLLEKRSKLTQNADVILDNTFLLALDGDVDFRPRSVELLLDLMKRDSKLGAACGRIHPTGSGPMIWYQKFEYALGHWLQKATEHVSGCVLCSPGCFSIFRARALMTHRVMGRYKTASTEPRHYVQYDQGEDRWLCTLLVQEGYRVDYSAASDACTHAPEDFNDFFTQRRRWIPSTTANIMDLLTDYKRTTRANSDVSFFYIGYQMFLLVGTVLGPGTIFLLLTGACITLFDLGDWPSFTLNLIPIAVFSFVCAYCSNSVQLKAAAVLSVGYVLLMVGVLVGIAIRVSKEGILAPSSLFLLTIAAIFVLTAILHPLEFKCLFSGLVYYVTIPSMYLLLIIYSVFNVNNVSWGTREKPKEKAKHRERCPEDGDGGLVGLLRGDIKKMSRSRGWFELGCGNLVRLVCCTREELPNEESNTETARTRPVLSRRSSLNDDDDQVPTNSQRNSARNSTSGSTSNPDPLYWTKDTCFVGGGEDSSTLSETETEFWTELISKYLFPLPPDKSKETVLAAGLRALRNSCVFYFFMANSMFVLLIFLMTLHEKSLSFKWPFGDGDLDLEPIGFLFVAFFLLILLFQFGVMLFHRFQTFIHILAATKLTRLPGEKEDAEKVKFVETVQKEEQEEGGPTQAGGIALEYQSSGIVPTPDVRPVENLETLFDRNLERIRNLPLQMRLKKLTKATGSQSKALGMLEVLDGLSGTTGSASTGQQRRVRSMGEGIERRGRGHGSLPTSVTTTTAVTRTRTRVHSDSGDGQLRDNQNDDFITSV